MNIPVKPPAESLDSFSFNPATVQHPDEWLLQSLPRLRKQAEQEVERLLNFLDLTDGYTFSEREPSLGFFEQHVFVGCVHGFPPGPGLDYTEEGDQTRPQGCTDDREAGDDEDAAVDDDRIDGEGDEEPWLGASEIPPTYIYWYEGYGGMWLTGQGNQENWSQGAGDSREIEDEHEEDGNDNEPSLGWTSSGVCAGANDVEHDDCDDEPSLGWTAEEGNNGRGAAGCYGRGHDLEEQCEDEGADPGGIGDMDGLLEQLAGTGSFGWQAMRAE